MNKNILKTLSDLAKDKGLDLNEMTVGEVALFKKDNCIIAINGEDK